MGQGCPEGQGGSESICVLGVEGLKKMPPPRIISGTALKSHGVSLYLVVLFAECPPLF